MLSLSQFQSDSDQNPKLDRNAPFFKSDLNNFHLPKNNPISIKHFLALLQPYSSTKYTSLLNQDSEA